MIKKKLRNGKICILRKPQENDAKNILDYLNTVSQETDFLTFGKDELAWTLKEEKKVY